MKKTFAYLVTLGMMAFLASGVAFAQDDESDFNSPDDFNGPERGFNGPERGFNGPGKFDDSFAKPGPLGADWGLSSSIDSSGRHPSVTVTTPWGDTDPSDQWHRSTGNAGQVYTGRSTGNAEQLNTPSYRTPGIPTLPLLPEVRNGQYYNGY